MTVDLSFCVRAVSLPQGPRPDGELDLVARSTTPNTPFGKSETHCFTFILLDFNTKYVKENPQNWQILVDLFYNTTYSQNIYNQKLHMSGHGFRSLQRQLHIFTKIFVLLVATHVFNNLKHRTNFCKP